MSTFTVTLSPSAGGGTDIVYAPNSWEAGRYARSLSGGAPIADLKRVHPPGTDGYLIVRSGQLGKKLTLAVAYSDEIAALYTAVQVDTLALSKAAYDITVNGYLLAEGCNLVPGSFIDTSPMTPSGREANVVRQHYTMQFTEDQPSVS